MAESPATNWKDLRPQSNLQTVGMDRFGIGLFGVGRFSSVDKTQSSWTVKKAAILSFLFAFLFQAPALAQDAFTTDLNLRKPQVGVEDTATPWGDKYNANLDLLDLAICDKRGSCTIAGSLTVGTTLQAGAIIGNSSVTVVSPLTGDGLPGSPVGVDSSSVTLLGASPNHDKLSNVTASQHHTKTTDASELTSGTLPNARLDSSSVTLLGASPNHDSLSNVTASQHHIKTIDASELSTGILPNARLDSSSVTLLGASPDHNSLSNVTASQHHTKTTDASELTSGTLPNDRLDSSSVTLQGQGIDLTCPASQFIESANIDGGVIKSGTCSAPAGVGDAVLSATQTFSGQNTFSNTIFSKQVPFATVSIDGDAVPAVARFSFGVSSVTDNGVGNYTVNFDPDLSDDVFDCICTAAGASDLSGRACFTREGTFSQFGVGIRVTDIGGSMANDSDRVMVTCWTD